MWVDNLQKTAYVVIAGNVASASVNVPEAEVSGVEGDLNIVPTDWLRLGGSISYTYGRFTDAQSVLFGTPATFGPFGDVPRFAGTLYGETVTDLPGTLGSLTFRTDLFAESSYYFSNLANSLTPGTKIPGYALINMRLDWSNMFGKGVTGSLWVKNLADRTYYSGGTAGAQDWTVEAATVGLPRTYGFTLRYNF
jgi:iron complex outermembrane receptor protein